MLLLAGSLYLMMVYDSVLPSHSAPTLFGLFAMVTGAYLFQAVFDILRARMLSDVGNSLELALSRSVQFAMGETARRAEGGPGEDLMPMRDLDSVRAFLAGPGPTALIDLPWVIFFIAVLFFLHYWLAATALAGAIILFAMTIVTDRVTRKPVRELAQIGAHRKALAESNLRHVELLGALGMRGRLYDRWAVINNRYLSVNMRLARAITLLSGISKVFRLFLQSSILTVGALLVLDNQASGGVIFASALLSGRALAPVDQIISNWRGFSQARSGWARLRTLLDHVAAEREAIVQIPLPTQRLEARQLTVVPPGSKVPSVLTADFALEAGEALGIIGPSAAGKTSLGLALVGIWKPVRGSVRLDGAALDQWDADRLGSAIGYLPQSVELLAGTVVENICRFEPDPPADLVVAAGRAAGVHEMIVRLPEGYRTPLGAEGCRLSAGQRQRIGLARALYRDPFLVVLDEPNSNLDAEGEAALEAAIQGIRARKGIAVVIAHRPAVLTHVSHLLVMREGRAMTFGLRDDVLRKLAVPVSEAKGRLVKEPVRQAGQ